MPQDDDLLPEDQPAENLMPEEQQAMAAEPAPMADVEPPSPVAAELSAKPKSNVWTLLMVITFISLLAGIYVQLRELNDIYKVNIIPIGGEEEAGTLPPEETFNEFEEDTGDATDTSGEAEKTSGDAAATTENP